METGAPPPSFQHKRTFAIRHSFSWLNSEHLIKFPFQSQNPRAKLKLQSPNSTKMWLIIPFSYTVIVLQIIIHHSAAVMTCWYSLIKGKPW